MSYRAKRAGAQQQALSRSRGMAVVSGIVCTVIAVAIVLPILVIIFTSFKNNQDFYTNIWGFPRVWRADNYLRAWRMGDMILFVRNSLTVTVTAVGGCLLLSAFAGYALSKLRVPMAKTVMSALMGLNFIPGVAIYLSLYIQMIRMGMNKTLLMLILPYLAWQIPFSVYIFQKFFDSIPSELLESARVDGSGELNTFFRIVLPTAKPAVSTVLIFNFISTWGEFMWASIASSSSAKIKTIPVGMVYFKGEFGIEWGPFAAAIVMIVLPMVCVFIYFQKYFIQGLTAGAVKG